MIIGSWAEQLSIVSSWSLANYLFISDYCLLQYFLIWEFSSHVRENIRFSKAALWLGDGYLYHINGPSFYFCLHRRQFCQWQDENLTMRDGFSKWRWIFADSLLGRTFISRGGQLRYTLHGQPRNGRENFIKSITFGMMIAFPLRNWSRKYLDTYHASTIRPRKCR